jgi:hypothetical protein
MNRRATAAMVGLAGALVVAGALGGQGCFGPVGVVGEHNGASFPRLRHGIYTDVLFGAQNESIAWVILSDDPNLCDVLQARMEAGDACFDGWGDVERLHVRLPGRPDGVYPVTGGPCFSEFGTLPDAAVCWEGDGGLGLNGFEGASADSGTVTISRWAEQSSIEGRLDVTFPDGGYALGSFQVRNCPILNDCCSEVGCF